MAKGTDAAGTAVSAARNRDLFLATTVAAAAALAWAALPGGSLPRVALATAVLFFVPGFLLIQAVLRAATTRRQRRARAAAAVGISPPIVGLLALSTAMLPGGFRPASIVLVLLVACLAFAGVAAWRRQAAAAALRRAAPAA